MRTIKASGLESEFFARWAGFFAHLANGQQELSSANVLVELVPPLLSALMTAAILGIGGYEAIQSRMSIGQLVAYQSLAAGFLLPVNHLVGLGGNIQELSVHLDRLDDVLRTAPVSEPATESAPDPPIRMTGRVEFRNVTFGYNPVGPPLIRDFSFTAWPGQRIAFVGPSGCGKSTVLKLLAGLYTPDSGEILLDGIPLQRIPREVLSHSLSMVDQEIHLFSASVRDNLTLWDSSTADGAVSAACRDALLEDVIAALPNAYRSPVLEGGENLSGGQRQRLEIARALASQPSILLMDEATSSLDADTEKTIDRNLRKRGITCLIAAHRLSTIRDSDQILVLDKGQVVERGVHEELIGRDGLYSALVTDDEALEDAMV
jgi:ATP-binding cassette subfamily C protein